jgi:(p)ppGpp synthase/HD superfamily hydrolase
MNIPQKIEQTLLQMSIQLRASFFANVAHDGQTRSDGSMYINHPVRVAAILRRYNVIDEEILAIAYLHDVIEDCDVTEEQLVKYFGGYVAHGVRQLTNMIEGDSHEKAHGHVPFTEKHTSLLSRCREMEPSIKWVKLADRLDNLQDAMKVWKPKRLQRYAKAGYEIVEALRPLPEGSEGLVAELLQVIRSIIPEGDLESIAITNDVLE